MYSVMKESDALQTILCKVGGSVLSTCQSVLGQQSQKLLMVSPVSCMMACCLCVCLNQQTEDSYNKDINSGMFMVTLQEKIRSSLIHNRLTQPILGSQDVVIMAQRLED